MKRSRLLLLSIIFILIALFATVPILRQFAYGAQNLSADSISDLNGYYVNGGSSYDALSDGDICFVFKAGSDREFVIYIYDSDSGQTEDSDMYVKPDYYSSGRSYTGTGRWVKMSAEVYNLTATGSVTSDYSPFYEDDTNNRVYLIDGNNRIGIKKHIPDADLDINGRCAIKNYNPILNSERQPPETITTEIDTNTYDAFGILDQFPNGKLIYIYREGLRHAYAGDYGVIRYITSTDQGATWNSPTTIASESNVDLRNVGGGITPNGRLVVAYRRYYPEGSYDYGSEYIYSDDEGLTWSDANTLAERGSSSPYQISSPYGYLIEIGDGKLMLPWYGREVDGNNIASSYESYVSFSTDNGKTWGNTVTVMSDPNRWWDEASYVYLGGNIILGLIRIETESYPRQVLSTDNGLTWTDQNSPDFDAFSTWKNPTMLRSYSDLDGKRIVACYYLHRDEKKMKVILAKAENLINNGVSAWDTSTKVVIGTSTHYNSGYPSAVQFNGTQHALVCWYNMKDTYDADLTFDTYPQSNMLSFTDIRIDPNGDMEIDISGDKITVQNDVDSETGFQILDADGGAPVLNVDTVNERIGIGIASPSNTLDVGPISGSNAVGVNSGTSGTGSIFFYDGSNDGAIQYNHSTRAMSFNVAAVASVFYINSSGYVGIGTNTPDKRLDITIADDTVNAGMIIQNNDGSISLQNGTGSANQFGPVTRGQSNGSGQSGITIMGTIPVADDTGTTPVVKISARQSDNTAIETRPLYQIQNLTTPVLTIDVNGNVGINTETPGGALDIAPGTTGGLYFDAGEATINMADANAVTCQVNIPSGSKIIGCQLRVDTALAGGDTWDARYDGGSTQSIASNQAVTKNTKVNAFYDENAASANIASEVDVTIVKNGGGHFTAQGTITAIVYYQGFTAMGDAT